MDEYNKSHNNIIYHGTIQEYVKELHNVKHLMTYFNLWHPLRRLEADVH